MEADLTVWIVAISALYLCHKIKCGIVAGIEAVKQGYAEARERQRRDRYAQAHGWRDWNHLYGAARRA